MDTLLLLDSLSHWHLTFATTMTVQSTSARPEHSHSFSSGHTAQRPIFIFLILLLFGGARLAQPQSSSPDEADQLCGQAMVARSLGALDDAATLFATAAGRGPNTTVMWLELGSTLAYLGQWQLAER